MSSITPEQAQQLNLPTPEQLFASNTQTAISCVVLKETPTTIVCDNGQTYSLVQQQVKVAPKTPEQNKSVFSIDLSGLKQEANGQFSIKLDIAYEGSYIVEWSGDIGYGNTPQIPLKIDRVPLGMTLTFPVKPTSIILRRL